MALIFSWISLPYAYGQRRIVSLPPTNQSGPASAAPLDQGCSSLSAVVLPAPVPVPAAVASLPRPLRFQPGGGGGGEDSPAPAPSSAHASTPTTTGTTTTTTSSVLLSALLGRSRSPAAALGAEGEVLVPAASVSASDVAAAGGANRPSSPAIFGPSEPQSCPGAGAEVSALPAAAAAAAAPAISATFSGSYPCFSALKSDLLLMLGRTLAHESLVENLSLRIGAIWALFVMLSEEVVAATAATATATISPAVSSSTSTSTRTSEVVCHILEHVLGLIRPPVLAPPAAASLHHSAHAVLTPEIQQHLHALNMQAMSALAFLTALSFQAGALASLQWISGPPVAAAGTATATAAASSSSASASGSGGAHSLSHLRAKLMQPNAASASMLGAVPVSSDSSNSSKDSSPTLSELSDRDGDDAVGSVAETVLEALCMLGEAMLAEMAALVMPTVQAHAQAQVQTSAAGMAQTQTQTQTQVSPLLNSARMGLGIGLGIGMSGMGVGIGLSGIKSPPRPGAGGGGGTGAGAGATTRPHAQSTAAMQSPERGPNASRRLDPAFAAAAAASAAPPATALVAALQTPLRREYCDLYANVVQELLHTLLEWIMNSTHMQHIMLGSSAAAAAGAAENQSAAAAAAAGANAGAGIGASTRHTAARTKQRVLAFIHACLNCHADTVQRVRDLIARQQQQTAGAGIEGLIAPLPRAAMSFETGGGGGGGVSPQHLRRSSAASYDAATVGDSERGGGAAAADLTNLPAAFVHACAGIADAAHMLLQHTLNRVHHFPQLLGVAGCEGDEEEEDEECGPAPGALVGSVVSEDNDPVLAAPSPQLVQVELRVRADDVLVHVAPTPAPALARSFPETDDATAAATAASSGTGGPPRIHMVFDDSVLITALERTVPLGGGGGSGGAQLPVATSVRLIVRDLTGKNVWDVTRLDADAAAHFQQLRAAHLHSHLQNQQIVQMQMQPASSSAAAALCVPDHLLQEAAARAQEAKFRALESEWLARQPVEMHTPRVSGTLCLPTPTRRRSGRIAHAPLPLGYVHSPHSSSSSLLSGVSSSEPNTPRTIVEGASASASRNGGDDSDDDSHDEDDAAASAAAATAAVGETEGYNAAASSADPGAPGEGADADAAAGNFVVRADEDPLEQLIN